PNIHGIVVHARDITERKQSQSEKIKLEEELRQAQKLEAIGRLAGGIAHDFNNLLTVITGFSKIALRELGPNHKSAVKIKEVEKAGERGASLIQQLMAFSRKQIFTPTPVNLNSVIDEMQNMLKRLIHEHIELVPILHPQPIMVKADPIQLEQVILNLCINARDAMPDGGKLILETQPLSLSREEAAKYADAKEGNYIRLSIIDSGHGMNGETLPHIFEPFFTTKQDGKGTGLGLATTHGIVKQSGGFIHVESESGKGTIFDVYLPVIKDEEMNKQRALNKNNPRGTETVLLVEDNREVRFLVREILKEHGYQVVEASHGKEALKVCKTFHDTIHLLLTDIVLPYKNGFELAKDVFNTQPSIKVLFFTGHAESMLIQNYLEKEDVFLLNKPFTPEELLQALRDVLDSPEQMPLRS
ncbi:response regulator, partial [bacterium]|nr:response regulator [bacterium]